MPLDIALVGLTERAFAPRLDHCVPLSAQQWISDSSPRWRVIVLGAKAIADIAPESAARWMHGRRCDAWLESPGVSPLPAAWGRAGFTDVACGEDLVGRLALRSHRAHHDWWPRFWLEPGHWCPELAHGSDRALRLACCVRRLASLHDVASFASIAGLSEQQLRRACRDELGAPPREILRRYCCAQVRAARAAGLGWADVARLVGFANDESLLHALRRSRAARGDAGI